MAVLTSPGRGAIGVIRVWGQEAVKAVDAVFRPARGQGLAGTSAGRPRLGRVGRGIGDEVVAVILPNEDPPAVELQCHGGAAAIGLVLDALRDVGATVVEPAVAARWMSASRIRADALLDLARAPTLRTAEILLEQAAGALDREFSQAIELIRQGDDAAPGRIARLMTRAQVGLRLISGWKVVIAGRPNVGKSRLLNALAGYQRAIVHSAPGTTRDVVTVATALDGWPVELVDTAGVRETDDPIERSGIERALRQAETADLVLKVLDGSEPLRAEDRELLARQGTGLVVVNKCDLPSVWTLEDRAAVGNASLNVSAERGDGMDHLTAAVVAALVPYPPEPDAGVPFRPEHLKALSLAAELLRAGDSARAAEALSDQLD